MFGKARREWRGDRDRNLFFRTLYRNGFFVIRFKLSNLLSLLEISGH